jgi:hypothetical protein
MVFGDDEMNGVPGEKNTTVYIASHNTYLQGFNYPGGFDAINNNLNKGDLIIIETEKLEFTFRVVASDAKIPRGNAKLNRFYKNLGIDPNDGKSRLILQVCFDSDHKDYKKYFKAVPAELVSITVIESEEVINV